MFSGILSIAMASAGSTPPTTPEEPSGTSVTASSTVDVWEGYSDLKKICTCESGQGTGEPQHLNINTGEVLRGEVNPDDIGACQINLYWNNTYATQLGYNVFKEEDNVEFAKILFNERGAKPWSWSSSCHGY